MFSPSTKVYMGQAYWGMGGEKIHVVGLRRISKEMVNCAVHVGVLENLRVKSVYSPGLWNKLKRLEAECFADEDAATHYLQVVARALEAYRPEKTGLEEKSGPWGNYETSKYRQL